MLLFYVALFRGIICSFYWEQVLMFCIVSTSYEVFIIYFIWRVKYACCRALLNAEYNDNNMKKSRAILTLKRRRRNIWLNGAHLTCHSNQSAVQSLTCLHTTLYFCQFCSFILVTLVLLQRTYVTWVEIETSRRSCCVSLLMAATHPASRNCPIIA